MSRRRPPYPTSRETGEHYFNRREYNIRNDSYRNGDDRSGRSSERQEGPRYSVEQDTLPQPDHSRDFPNYAYQNPDLNVVNQQMEQLNYNSMANFSDMMNMMAAGALPIYNPAYAFEEQQHLAAAAAANMAAGGLYFMPPAMNLQQMAVNPMLNVMMQMGLYGVPPGSTPLEYSQHQPTSTTLAPPPAPFSVPPPPPGSSYSISDQEKSNAERNHEQNKVRRVEKTYMPKDARSSREGFERNNDYHDLRHNRHSDIRSSREEYYDSRCQTDSKYGYPNTASSNRSSLRAVHSISQNRSDTHNRTASYRDSSVNTARHEDRSSRSIEHRRQSENLLRETERREDFASQNSSLQVTVVESSNSFELTGKNHSVNMNTNSSSQSIQSIQEPKISMELEDVSKALDRDFISKQTEAPSLNESMSSYKPKNYEQTETASNVIEPMIPQSTAEDEKKSFESSLSSIQCMQKTDIPPEIKKTSPKSERKDTDIQIRSEDEGNGNKPPEASVKRKFQERSESPVIYDKPAQKKKAAKRIKNGSEERPSRTLFIRSLSKKFSESEVEQIFRRFGDIFELNLNHHQSRGLCFVSYHDLRDAMKAHKDLNIWSKTGPKIRAHFSKPKEWEDVTMPCTREHHQGTIHVGLRKAIFSDDDEPRLYNLFAKSGPIKGFYDSETAGRPNGRIIEYFDDRHSLHALETLQNVPFNEGKLQIRLEWEMGRLLPLEKIKPITINEEKLKNVASVEFFIDNHGDKTSRKVQPVPVKDIVGKEFYMDEVHEELPTPVSVVSNEEMKSNNEETVDEMITNSPHLLAQMTDLLSSLQKPSQKSNSYESLQSKRNGFTQPTESTGGVMSKGGVVKAEREKKEPSLESVQQLARLLLSQTNSNDETM